MKSCKRILSSVMALMLVLSLGSFAMAATPWDGGNANIVVTPVSSTSYAENGIAYVQLTVKNVGTDPILIEYTGLSFNDSATIAPSISALELEGLKNYGIVTLSPAGNAGSSMDIRPAVQIQSVDRITGTTKIALNIKIHNADSSTTDVIEYVTDGTNVSTAIPVTIAASTSGNNGGGNDGGGSSTPGSAFRLSPVDANGTRVNAPSGNYGDKVTVRIPLVAKASVSSVTISPVITTSLDTFPFVISNVDYTLSYPGPVNAGQIIMFEYTFTLSKKVTAGVKQIDFAINATGGSWDPVGTTYTDKVSIFLTVVKGATATDGTGTPPAVSTPKLIVQSYSFSTDKLYAGETFDVTIVLRNTSETETIQNLQIHIEDATNTVLPASAGSNTLYVAKIGKGETHTETISLQSTPGAEAKAYTMSLEMDYEAASTKTAYKASETIAVPILQKIRVKADNPIVYDEAWVGSPCAMYIAFYNLGKSTVYNCTISVEGEGITMEEGYFGGNVASGSTMNADFTIIPSVAGDISANVVIAYEDVYGEAYELKMPVSLYVNDSGNMGGDGGIVDGGVIEPMPGVDGKPINGEMPIDGGMQQGMPTWVWIAIGVAVAAGAVVLIVLLKRRRKKELEEI